MAIDNRTLNRNYRLPNTANLMKSEDVPRLILSLEMIDEDMATVVADVLGKAPSVHEHEMGAIVGLLGALAGKSPVGHNHGIGTLGGVDLSGATSGQFMKFGGTLWIPAFIQAADLANKIITNTKLRDSDALTVIGRAAASIGSPGDISATTNDRLLARVADAIAFVQLTLGMVPDNLLTFAKLASAAIASQTEAEAGSAANKLMTSERTKQAIEALGGAGVKVTILTSSASFVKDPKAKQIRFQCQGGGGGGGGIASAGSTGSSGHGTAGAYVDAIYNASSVGSSVSVVVGGAGPGGSGNNGGGDGGNTTVGSLITCPGGKQGNGSPANGTGGSGALPTAPTVTGAAWSMATRGRSTLSSICPNDPEFGRSGDFVATNQNGGDAVSLGGGGTGCSKANSNSYAGGAGKPGYVIITEIF